MSTHDQFLLKALQLAQTRLGFCAPNPACGAVIVKEGVVIGSGVHFSAGKPHAEVEALREAGEAARDAVLYVTLEPCCHWGKTPPCTEAIIRAGIRSVYYGFRDPNPQVSGLGAAQLHEAGIACELRALPEITAFYDSYAHWVDTSLPFVTAKIAISLDGKYAGVNASRIQLTGEVAEQYTHAARRASDAILTTVETVLTDDPVLTARSATASVAKPVYVLDSQLRFPEVARLLRTGALITVFYSAQADLTRLPYLEAQGLRCVLVEGGLSQLDLQDVFAKIGAQGIHSLWVEVGGRCLRALLQQSLLQRLLVMVAPQLLGEQALSAFLTPAALSSMARSLGWQMLGQDALLTCDF